MRTYHLAVIPGDGIGPEVVTESVLTLTSLAAAQGSFHFDIRHFDWGTERYLREGAMMTVNGLTTLEQGRFDGSLLGPIGAPRVPDHITLWGLILPIRQAFDQYVNLRPLRLLPGVHSPLVDKHPQDIDIVCIRENTEGEYAGVGGRVHQGTRDEVAIQSTILNRSGNERIMRYEFEYAKQYGRKKVTSAIKSNSMQFAMVFWDEIFHQVAAEYPDVSHEQQLIDSLAARFVSHPESLDIVVASNLFNDILTDLRAAISDSLRLAPSANLDPQQRYPSLFQAIHNSAPDIADKGIANPLASIWSGQLLLDFLGERETAALLMRAIKEVLANGQAHTPDLGGTATTRQLGEAIREKVQSLVAQ